MPQLGSMSHRHDHEPVRSRKQRREHARRERRALEARQAGGVVRRKRLLQFGGVAFVVAVVIAIIVVATGTGGAGKAVAPKSSAANQTVAEVTALLDGIPQSGHSLGSSSAPVTLQYFGDLECPVCRQFTIGALPALIAKYVRSGKLKIEYRSLQTATRESQTFRTQQTAALATGEQDKMWYYVELFYHEQGEEDSGYVTESYLQGLASQVPGLNLTAWTSARGDPSLAKMLASDAQAAERAGFTGTPSFLVGRSSGSLRKLEYASLTDPLSFEGAIERLLRP
jgi:protein-disulfide isomerase